MTLFSILCAVAGFALFALSTDEHHLKRLGTRPSPSRKRRWRAAAWIAVLAALPPAVRAQGWIFGPVLWLAVLMLGAGIVFMGFNLVPVNEKKSSKPARKNGNTDPT